MAAKTRRRTTRTTGTTTTTKTNKTATVNWGVFFENSSSRAAVISFARGKSITFLSKNVFGPAKAEVRKLRNVPIHLARKRAQSALDRKTNYNWR